MAEESVCDGCYEQLKRAMGLQLPWYRLIERVSEMVKEQDKDTMSRHRIEELEAQLLRLLEDRAAEPPGSDEAALARAREEGERKGWEDCMIELGMAIARDHGVAEKLSEKARGAGAEAKAWGAKVKSGEAYYDFLKFRAPEGVKIGYGDSDSSKKEGK